MKINSEVSTDDDKKEFLNILKTGEMFDKQKSKYAKTYKFFKGKIDEFLSEYPSYFAYLPTRILNNCILLPIEAESQDTALRIFSTLNDRGKPLSDTDIFKAQFYKYYSDKGEKDMFIGRWKELEQICDKIFVSLSGSPMDELFTRYMYYERARMGIKLTTTEALRKFYEKNEYEILKRDNTLDNLENLAKFWNYVERQDDNVFSEQVLKKLSVLRYAPNGMWTYLVSVYFLQNKDANNQLEDKSFFDFLDKITAFIWAYAVMRPGVNALRIPVYPAMIDIVKGAEVEFSNYKFDKDLIRATFENYVFTNGRPITKSMLAWWAYHDVNQTLISHGTTLEIEHIYPKKRQENECGLSEKGNLESLGNKALLEKGINIRASDYRFADKKKYYIGYTNSKGIAKDGTKISELQIIAKDYTDYTEQNVIDRKNKILDEFIKYLEDMGLID